MLGQKVLCVWVGGTLRRTAFDFNEGSSQVRSFLGIGPASRCSH